MLVFFFFKGAVPVLLISHPLRARGGKSWPSHPATLGFDVSVDPFLAMSPIQGSSPRELQAESEDEAVDRIQVESKMRKNSQSLC